MTKPTLPDVLKTVAEFAETVYPGFEQARVVIRVREGLPDAEFPVSRLPLFLPDDASTGPS